MMAPRAIMFGNVSIGGVLLSYSHHPEAARAHAGFNVVPRSVGEQVHTMQQQRGNLLEGAVIGTQQVSLPVIFGVLTTVATFMPLLLGPGTFGQIFGVVATAVICCLVVSLMESQLILPSHLGHSRSESATTEVGLLLIPIIGIKPQVACCVRGRGACCIDGDVLSVGGCLGCRSLG